MPRRARSLPPTPKSPGIEAETQAPPRSAAARMRNGSAKLTDDHAHWQARAATLAERRCALAGPAGAGRRARRAGSATPRGAAGTPAAGRGAATPQRARTPAASAPRSSRPSSGCMSSRPIAGTRSVPLQSVASRRERLLLERQALPTPDLASWRETGGDRSNCAPRSASRSTSRRSCNSRCRIASSAARTAGHSPACAEGACRSDGARRSALQQLQQRLQANGKLEDWLRRHGLQTGRQALWKSLQVEAGWEAAVEAVLRERLGALPADAADAAWSKRSAGQQADPAAAPGTRHAARLSLPAKRCSPVFVATRRNCRRFLPTGSARC
jgi:chromosome segregation protein